MHVTHPTPKPHVPLPAAFCPAQVLNAKPENVERESEIVAQSGRKASVTISTNMAGRGTDILLGGNPEYMVRLMLACPQCTVHAVGHTLAVLHTAAMSPSPAAIKCLGLCLGLDTTLADKSACVCLWPVRPELGSVTMHVVCVYAPILWPLLEPKPAHERPSPTAPTASAHLHRLA